MGIISLNILINSITKHYYSKANRKLIKLLSLQLWIKKRYNRLFSKKFHFYALEYYSYKILRNYKGKLLKNLFVKIL